MLQALNKEQFGVVLHLSPCCGLRPWQLLELDLQVAFTSPIYGMSAKEQQFGTRDRNLAKAQAPLPL